MSEKFCIFCGKKPENKNLEHVIPQWLIRLAGQERKDVFAFLQKEHRHLTFLNYKFPACTKCNTKYADMEARVKPVMENVLSGGTISGTDASLLLDWFDKVRVGLWLTEMFYNPKLKDEVEPHFFIDSRVGTADRMLSIKKLDIGATDGGILFNGTNSVLFTYCPSAFTMVINDYYFFNASNTNIVSPRIGFPIVRHAVVMDKTTGKFSGDIDFGRQKILSPVIKGFLPDKDSITFYQPIYKDFIGVPMPDTTAEYVAQHSYDAANGIGGVFVQKGNTNNIRYLQETDKTNINIKPIKFPDIARDVVNFQNTIYEVSPVKNAETQLGMMINKQFLENTK